MRVISVKKIPGYKISVQLSPR